MIDDAIMGRGNPEDGLVLYMQFQVAAHAAVWAGGWDDAVRFEHTTPLDGTYCEESRV